MKKCGIILCFTLLIFGVITMSGCKKKGGNTPLEEAYNAIWNSRKDIDGLQDDSYSYDAQTDTLTLVNSPGLDTTALIKVLNDTVAGREVNCIYLESGHHSDNENSYPMFKEFIDGFNAPLKRLKLISPVQIDGSIDNPQLWKESLSSLKNVDELQISGNLKFFKDIAGDDMLTVSCNTLVIMVDPLDRYDFSMLNYISNLNHLCIESYYTSSQLPQIEGIENLDSTKVTINLGAFSGDLECAKLVYKLRSLGFIVEGVPENIRDSLTKSNDAASFDEYSHLCDRYFLLVRGEGSLADRIELCLSIIRDYDFDLTEASENLLLEIYSQAETSDFPKYVQKICSDDSRFSDSPHVMMLKYIYDHTQDSDKWNDFASEIGNAFPDYGEWCETIVEINGTKTSALSALTNGFSVLINGPNNDGRHVYISDPEQADAVYNALDGRGLLNGVNDLSKYATIYDKMNEIDKLSSFLSENAIVDEAEDVYPRSYGFCSSEHIGKEDIVRIYITYCFRIAIS